jgi:hypothetical protein
MSTEPQDLPFVAQLKANPDRLIVTNDYIAMHCVDIGETIIIPGHFYGVTFAQAKVIFDLNLKKITS